MSVLDFYDDGYPASFLYLTANTISFNLVNPQNKTTRKQAISLLEYAYEIYSHYILEKKLNPFLAFMETSGKLKFLTTSLKCTTEGRGDRILYNRMMKFQNHYIEVYWAKPNDSDIEKFSDKSVH